MKLPIAIIGAGPVGLAAAAHALSRSEEPVIFELGTSVGHNLLQWGHVRMFSPWEYNIDKASAALLAETGWKAPDPKGLPTGGELVTEYLLPLARHPKLRGRILTEARVVAVTRDGLDKVKATGRENLPFLIHVEFPGGVEKVFRAKAVIDASGTYQSPNPMSSSGVHAPGERALSDRIAYGIPDVLGKHRGDYAGKKVLVVGSGHSASNALLDLAALAEQDKGTAIYWALRKPKIGDAFGGGEKDGLPARGALGTRLKELVDAGRILVFPGFRITALARQGSEVLVHGTQNGADASLPPVDRIIVATGARPDLSMLRELRLGLDPALESTPSLAPLIDPNVHSCGTVRPHGEKELRHPEPGLYIVGMKSYGRAPTFLMTTGYEQVRSILAYLKGDVAAAEAVELVLPETGVCSIGLTDCCKPESSEGSGAEAASCGTSCGTEDAKEEEEAAVAAAACGARHPS